MRSKIENDPTYQIVARIMSKPVPLQSELTNPFAANKRRKKLLLNPDEKKDNTLPDDVLLWSVKSFVDYFADTYKDKTGGYYKKTYAADNAIFSEIGKFFSSNGLQKQEWTKKFIDWCFVNQSKIIEKSGYLLPTSIINYLNHFYQEEVMPKVEENTIDRSHFESSLLDEIKQVDKESKASHLFYRFGIPIAATYFLQIKGIKEETVVKGLEVFMNTLANGDAEQRNMLSIICERSVMKSPYPEEFNFLDWRERYKTYSSRFNKENWWRDNDYKGKPLSEYGKLIKRD